MKIFAVCENKECKHVGKLRETNLQKIGKGLYTVPILVCECQDMQGHWVEMRQVGRYRQKTQ